MGRQAVLLEAVGQEECAGEALNALLSFCWYQHWTLPRMEVVECTVRATKPTKNERCVAEGLRCRGNMILYALDRYDGSGQALEQSRRIFRTLDEPLGAA